MVRIAYADDYLLTYLTNVAKKNTYAVGLILGQSCLGRDYIIHFAKTPVYHPEELKKQGLPAKQIKNIVEVNDNWVAEHARHATRMLPGGMFVLGIFLVSPEDIFSQFSGKAKSILTTVHKQLEGNIHVYGNADCEKLVLNYCTKTEKYLAKSYDVATSRIQPAEFKFSSKASKWNNLECSYVIDQVYFLKTNEADWPLQKHVKGILEDISEHLESSIFLYDSEFKEGDETLENVGKKRKVPRTSSSKTAHDQDISKPIQVSILQAFSTNSSTPNSGKLVVESAGQLRIVGQVVCKLWLQPKMTISEASKAVKQDITRSLYSRFEMHWDCITEEENSEAINCVHEPPRRVLVTLPNSKITLSDYLFPGEGSQDAKDSLEELLDIQINGKIEINDAEGQADIAEYYKTGLDSESEETLPKLSTDPSLVVYLVGLVAGLLVLIVSLILHFYK